MQAQKHRKSRTKRIRKRGLVFKYRGARETATARFAVEKQRVESRRRQRPLQLLLPAVAVGDAFRRRRELFGGALAVGAAVDVLEGRHLGWWGTRRVKVA
jgi:hypothetical protein